jgi:hypothetical protein
MPSLSFKSRFVDAVVAGTKPHSFRAMRKRPFKVGDIISHFTGPRMKPRRIRANTVCVAAPVMTIDPRARTVHLEAGSTLYKSGNLSVPQLRRLAERDGFDGIDSFFRFFLEKHGGLVTGQLVEWNPHAAVSGVVTPGAHQEETALGASASVDAATPGAHDADAK